MLGWKYVSGRRRVTAGPRPRRQSPRFLLFSSPPFDCIFIFHAYQSRTRCSRFVCKYASRAFQHAKSTRIANYVKLSATVYQFIWPSLNTLQNFGRLTLQCCIFCAVWIIYYQLFRLSAIQHSGERSYLFDSLSANLLLFTALKTIVINK